MKLNKIALVCAILSGHVFAEDGISLPTDVVNPGKIVGEAKPADTSNPIPDALKKVNESLDIPGVVTNNPTTPATLPQEQQILLQMAQAAQAAAPKVAPSTTSIADEWASQAKKKYKPEQKVLLRPGGNIMLPVAIGLMNTVNTSFKHVSVKSSDPNAILETDGSTLYVTVNARVPVGLLIMEEGVPSTAVNITVVPTDVPAAMIAVNVPISDDQIQQAEDYQKLVKDEEIVEKANSEEKEIKRSDRHTERLKEILKTTALGSIPAGFTLSDDEMKKMISAYRHPCVFGIANETKQRLVGARELIDVVLVQNDSNKPYTIKEEYCSSQDTVAVGVLDKAQLNPGEQIEMYIIRDKLWLQQQERLQTRPRVTNQK